MALGWENFLNQEAFVSKNASYREEITRHRNTTNTIPRVLFYVGTFNPPHLGHLDAVKCALECSAAHFAVVVADDRDNEHKPNRLPVVIRTKMLELLLEEKNSIYVSGEPVNVVRKVLCETAHVIHLIGSDVFERYRDDKILKGQCYYPEVVVCQRKDGKNDLPEGVDGKEVTYASEGKSVKVQFFEQKEGGHSSTSVRKTLSEHKEWYTSEASVDVDLPMLPESVANYILENRLYSPLEQAMLDEMVRKIKKQHRGKRVIVNQRDLGLSCNRIFKVNEWGKSAITFVKGFMKNSFMEDLHYECRALDIMNRPLWEWVRTPKFLWWDKGEEYRLLAESFVQGTDMGNFWMEAESRETASFKEEIARQAFCIGRALNELHNRRKDQMVDAVFTEQFDAIKLQSSEMLYSLQSKIDEDKYNAMCDDLFVLTVEYGENPGKLTYMHGNADPSHFFVDDNGMVTFVGLEHMGRATQDETYAPAGFPAYDYFHFMESLSRLPDESNASESLVKLCRENFEKGYSQGAIPFTDEAKAFYQFYFQLYRLSASGAGGR